MTVRATRAGSVAAGRGGALSRRRFGAVSFRVAAGLLPLLSVPAGRRAAHADDPPATLDTSHVVAVGDSVLLGAAPVLEQMVPAVTVDAAVSRQIATVTAILAGYAAAGQLGDFVVIHTGNNGPVSPGQFGAMMDAVAGAAHVILVNTNVPRAWQEPNDDLFAGGVPLYANAELIDWLQASAGHPEYFWDDGIHLRPDGAWAFSALIAARLSVYGVSVGGE